MSNHIFPGTTQYSGGDGNKGLTLRDYFAGQALIGCCGLPNNSYDKYEVYLAELSYKIADAMLVERNKQKG